MWKSVEICQYTSLEFTYRAQFSCILQQSVCWGGGMACMERDAKPVTGWYLWEWTSVTIDIKWRQQIMFLKFTDTNTGLQFLFTLFSGWLFYFYSQVFANLILILSDFNRKGLQPAVGNGRILSRLNLSKQGKEKKGKNNIFQAQLLVPLLPGFGGGFVELFFCRAIALDLRRASSNNIQHWMPGF